MYFRFRASICVIFSVCCSSAHPSVCSVISTAIESALTPGTQFPVCPGYPAIVAPGSIIAVTGTGLGPAQVEGNGEFPLRITAAGVSVRLTVGGVAVDAFVMSAQQSRVQAMLPSRTPVGEGSLVVTYNGLQSTAYRVQVVERRFQILRRGPLSVAQNIGADGAWQANGFATPARPSQLMVLWGTGLGAVQGDESAGPAPSPASGAGVEVWFGLVRARVLYAGRSGCCPGIDQIVVETPAGIEGCSVPVAVRPFLNDLDGSFPSVAVASRGGCSDPHGVSEPVRQRMAASGGGKVGFVLLGQYGWSPDGMTAYFTRFGNRFVIPAGTCGHAPAGNYPAPGESVYWDAGASLVLNGGSVEWAAPQDFDNYNTDLGSHYERGFDSGNLGPGRYSIRNGDGGSGVGAFRIDFPIFLPAAQWTNQSSFDELQRGQDLKLTWAADATDDGYMIITGGFLTFTGDPNGYGVGGFTCLERADKGSFTVPGWMIWTDRVAGAEGLDLGLQHYRQQEFAAPGLDYGQFFHAEKRETHRSKIAGQ